MTTDPIGYVLSSLRRAADNAYPWSLTPTEAGALVAEVERLREFRNNALHAGNDEVAEAVAEERAAVVAWVRAQGVIEGSSPDERNMARWVAHCIERGEHRREEEK